MPNFINLAGKRFGKLIVLKRSENSKNRATRFCCRCDCGNETIVFSGNLIKGHTKSCGCDSSRKTIAERRINTTHGMSNTKIFAIWNSMLQRCNNSKHRAYPNYGGRGITVCERWNEFENFFADMGEPPHRKSLDRINNALGYSPENCRWATSQEQNNNCRNNHWIEFNGQTKTLSQWAKDTGIVKTTILNRIKAGWPIHRILTEPVNNHIVEFNGQHKTLPQWAKTFKISYVTLRARLFICNWPLDRALSTPVHPRHFK